MKNCLTIYSICSAIVFLPLVLSAQTLTHSSGPQDKYVVVEGSKMRYQTGGSGTASVVFENGHGDNLHAWDNIFPQVAKFAKVVRYDREGYGLSEPNSQPQSFKQIVARLHELLHKAGIQPPYVLVGHSMGGMLIRAFAFLYPDEVAGLVYVDPINEYMGDNMSKEERIQGAVSMDSIVKQDSIVLMKGIATFAAEWKIMRNEFLGGFPEANSFGAPPDVPMVLLVAGKGRPPGWENTEKELFANKMQALSETRFIDLPQSPHYIQNYEPSLIIENIRRVVFPDAENILRKVLRAKGVDSCIAHYKRLKAVYPKEYILERFLNTLGYETLHEGHIQDAIRLFAFNVEMYPGSSNVYDSLGEAYMDAGNKKEAIKNYERSLALNPDNVNAVNMLKKIK